MTRPRILFIDAYDSFSNNIVSLLTTVLDADVDILPIDPPQLDPTRVSFEVELSRELRRYHAVVCGPGPGTPDAAEDVGLMRYVWELKQDDLLPVLGICLGFQSLIVHCGGNVRRLQTGLHGMIRKIDHSGTYNEQGATGGNIFQGVPPFKATLYHSLHADIGQDSISAHGWNEARWTSPAHLPEVVPLAWAYEYRGTFTERILMGVKHRTKPFWGLQYHPESICTETIGHQVIRNWFNEAMQWNKTTGRQIDLTPRKLGSPSRVRRLSTPQAWETIATGRHSLQAEDHGIFATFALDCAYHSQTLDIPIHLEVPDILETLQQDQRDSIVLDSASAKAKRTGADVRGRYSIIALDVDEALRLEYKVGDRSVNVYIPKTSNQERVELAPGQNVWQLLADFWTRRQHVPGDESTPFFLGGFMGYTTYELGLEGINVELPKDRGHERPDLCFTWITKSIVIDHMEGTLRIQNLSQSASDSQTWITDTAQKLLKSSIWSDGLRANFETRQRIVQPTPPDTPTSESPKPKICAPDTREYEAKVHLCQHFIAAGDSYELCLTDQTLITQPKLSSPSTLNPPADPSKPSNPSPSSSWSLYRALRTRQPAPFGSYIRLGGATLISSSPERFLTYTSSGLCSMRPMKGTVRKSAMVSTLEQAGEILHVPKEEAENLMIVDLVRHDLHAVCGPGNVSVPRLLVVEEYASVFQMISVVEGQLPSHPYHPEANTEARRHVGGDRQVTGLDVLSAALPPGSMTGAPKKRSCEILRQIENGPCSRTRERSLYSGVVGYMCVTGRGDWSVTIRSLFRWDDETAAADPRPSQSSIGGGDEDAKLKNNGEIETWHIGAGGAVTALSTPEGERDEMFTKLRGPLGVFEGA
ncbi:aminodeoxychorismate synthase [Xylariomycetidae sp. FL2044]|nr:aminodeoxychorismate synthase [Xylariomycetidae sp. FL2044]